jgi:hypothetical protein
MEKFLLILALFGSAQIAIRGLWKLVKLAFLAVPKPTLCGAGRSDVRPIPLRKEGGEDWSKYEIPTFIRRGMPMPQLEPVPVKTRKRRSKKAEVFEVVA